MPQVSPTKYVVTATWNDAPHLSEKQKEELWDSIPPFQRDARTKGIPQLGAGAIYPLAEERFIVDDFDFPAYWPRAYGFDVGWNNTAAVWGCLDRLSDTVYLYSCYKQGQAEPATHADSIKSRGDWIPGAIDPASMGSGQLDGKRLFEEYERMLPELYPADNAVEAGIHAVYRRLVSGRLKVFRSLLPWLEEFRLYRRDDKGKVVKDNDHLMDATRYLIMTGMRHAVDEFTATNNEFFDDPNSGPQGTTGY
jgi:hypothetical protein